MKTVVEIEENITSNIGKWGIFAHRTASESIDQVIIKKSFIQNMKSMSMQGRNCNMCTLFISITRTIYTNTFKVDENGCMIEGNTSENIGK